MANAIEKQRGEGVILNALKIPGAEDCLFTLYSKAKKYISSVGNETTDFFGGCITSLNRL